MNHDTNNEIARLKEEIKKLKSAAQEVVDRWETPLWKDAEPTASVIYRLRNALASAPEEPTTEESSSVEPSPEWRELGPDETIQEGDEVFSLGIWIPVSPNLVIPFNDKRKPEVRFRTRRPLPKQKTGYCEPAPECPNCKNNTMVWQEKDFYNHWVCHRAGCGKPVGKPKQEEIPLEDELKDIDQYADRQNDFHTCRVFQSIEYSLHYLRDEIETLKKNQK